MAIWVKLIGLIMVIFGTVFFIIPEKMRHMIDFFAHGKRLYISGAVRVVFGLLLLAAASESYWPVFVRVLGILTLLAGIAIFALGPVRFMPMLKWWVEKNNTVLRIVSVGTAAFGILVVCAAG